MKITIQEFDSLIKKLLKATGSTELTMDSALFFANSIQVAFEGKDGCFDELINNMISCIDTIQTEIEELASFINEVDVTGYEIIETEDIFGDDDEV
jgi:hypothetical protein